MSETKPFIISKDLVMQAYKLIKANAGAAGIDKQSLDDFELNWKDNRNCSPLLPVTRLTGGERCMTGKIAITPINIFQKYLTGFFTLFSSYPYCLLNVTYDVSARSLKIIKRDLDFFS